MQRRFAALAAAVLAVVTIMSCAHGQELSADGSTPGGAPVTIAGPGPISPSIAGMQCNNGLTKECSLFSDTYFQGERFVISALAIQGWVFYLNAGRAKSGAILIRCRGADTNTCDTYSVMSEGTWIAPLVAVPGHPYFMMPINGVLYRCHIDAPGDQRCALWSRAGGDFYSLTVSGDTVFAGIANGEVLMCPTGVVNACKQYQKSVGSPVRSITHTSQFVFLGLDNGNLMRCFINQVNSCSIWARLLNSGRMRALAAMADGLIYAGLDDGKIFRCSMDRPDTCELWNVATGLSTFFVLPATPTTMYIARDGAGTIASCSTNGIHNCQSVVDAVGYRNNYGVGEQGVYCITGEGEYLYTSPVVLILVTAKSRAWLNYYMWMKMDTCVDRTVKEILAADPVPFDTFDNKVTAGTGTAKVTATSVNYGYYTQSAQAQASVARQVSVAVSFSRAVQQAWKLELKIKTPFIDEVIVGYSGSVTVTEGTTTTVADTATFTGSLTITTPPRNNCTAHGTLETVSQSWTQRFRVLVKYACGATGEEYWDARIAVGSLVASYSRWDVVYDECTIIPLQINHTCASNPGCKGPFMDDPKKLCCPMANGTYLKCCAIAKAVTPPCEEGRDYILPTEFICPNTAFVWKKCCPDASRVLPGTPAQALAEAVLLGPALGANSAFNESSNITLTTVCPDGFEAHSGKRIAGGGYLLCMRMVDWPPAPGSQVVTDIVVSSGSTSRGWNRLACPSGYTMLPFVDVADGGADDGVPQVADKASRMSAVCVRYESASGNMGSGRRARSPVAGVRVVTSRSECAAMGRAWRMLPGNLGAAWPGFRATFLCVTRSGGAS